MIDIGKVARFIVNRETSSGYYLKEVNGTDEVFMPPSMAPLKVKLTTLFLLIKLLSDCVLKFPVIVFIIPRLILLY